MSAQELDVAECDEREEGQAKSLKKKPVRLPSMGMDAVLGVLLGFILGGLFTVLLAVVLNPVLDALDDEYVLGFETVDYARMGVCMLGPFVAIVGGLVLGLFGSVLGGGVAYLVKLSRRGALLCTFVGGFIGASCGVVVGVFLPAALFLVPDLLRVL